jgi:predicted kinase
MLIVFGGLPATGKTTLARGLAAGIRAAYQRIDTIEQALRDLNLCPDGMEDQGYVIAYRLAEENLRLGLTVVADSVNPIAVTREAWRAVAAKTGAPLLEIETICSDAAEHRRRVEAREVDVPGLVAPTWQEVIDRDYEPWDAPHIVIDTAHRTPEESLEELIAKVRAQTAAESASRSGG